MAASLQDQLVVAISSRALFNFEEENRFFESGDPGAYMALQLERLELPAKPGIAFSLIKKLLAFNEPGLQRVEVVILSRNDPVSGMRIFRSGKANQIKLERGVFRGAARDGHLKASLLLGRGRVRLASRLGRGLGLGHGFSQAL